MGVFIKLLYIFNFHCPSAWIRISINLIKFSFYICLILNSMHILGPISEHPILFTYKAIKKYRVILKNSTRFRASANRILDFVLVSTYVHTSSIYMCIPPPPAPILLYLLKLCYNIIPIWPCSNRLTFRPGTAFYWENL